MLRRALFHGMAAPAARLRRLASTLVLGETTGASVTNGTLSAVTAAGRFGGPVTLLISDKGAAGSAAGVAGVAKVLVADSELLRRGVAEPFAALVAALQAQHKFSHIVGVTSNAGKNVVPRAAVALDVAPITDVTGVTSADTFERPMYAGNAIATVRSADAVKLLTIRPTSFEKAGTGGAPGAPVEELDAGALMAAGGAAQPQQPPTPNWVRDEVTKSERPELGSAAIVVSGGRALKSADNFQLLYALADKMGGAVGASRAAVDAGYVSNDLQVGQTGKVVAPKLYIAAGISGAIQHLAGMKDSKVIVAINKDAEAPIFAVADYGLVGDLFTLVPEITAKVSKA